MILNSEYSLVHVECDELSTPLLHTQLYERAYQQTKFNDRHSPKYTYVLAFEAASRIQTNKYGRLVKRLRGLYSPVKFLLFPYSSRIGFWLTIFLMKIYRFLFMKGRVIFHCRGTSALQWANRIKSKQDKVLLDIRGYDPIEVFARSNKFDPSEFSSEELIEFEKVENILGEALNQADRIITVSNPLADYIKNRFNISKNIVVIPCVGPMEDSLEAPIIRSEEIIKIAYVGGTQHYQALKELVIPFSKALLEVEQKIEIHFISQDLPIIKRYLSELNINSDRIVCTSLPQSEVKLYLKKIHLGLLLRAPSLMNSFSQPVKLGEYLAAGMGVIYERGTGDLKTLLDDRGIGIEVNLWQKTHIDYVQEAIRVIDFIKKGRFFIPNGCLKFVQEEYSWGKYASVENLVYKEMMAD